MDITSILTYLKGLIPTIMTLLMMLSPASFGSEATPYTAERPDELITSFAVVSDVHVETNNPDAYSAYYSLLEDMKATEDIDTAVFLGDNVMNGQTLENLFFYAGLRGVNPAENNLVALGNHDIGNGHGSYEELSGSFVSNNALFLGNKIEKPYYYKVIDGCYMIFLASEDLTVDTYVLSDEQLTWLEGVLNEADGKDAPIFVFNHHPLYSFEGAEYDKLAELIDGYDVLYLYGHTHLPLTSDSFKVEGGISTIGLSRSTETVDYEAGDGIVVEVYEDEIVVRGRNFVKGEWIDGLRYSY